MTRKARGAMFDAADRACGRHSGIPSCCVEAFIAGRTAIDSRDQGVGYVRCVECIARNHVAIVKPCPQRVWVRSSKVGMWLACASYARICGWDIVADRPRAYVSISRSPYRFYSRGLCQSNT